MRAHPHDTDIRTLYATFLAGCNQRSSVTVSGCLTDDADVIGFEGTAHHGRLSIAAYMRRLFADYATPTYVGLVRSVRPIAEDVAVLHAVAGMVPPGANDLDPTLLALHTVIAVDGNGRWKISVLQATPAQYLGRPEVIDALTAELRTVR